jgi:hypothetical protein
MLSASWSRKCRARNSRTISANTSSPHSRCRTRPTTCRRRRRRASSPRNSARDREAPAQSGAFFASRPSTFTARGFASAIAALASALESGLSPSGGLPLFVTLLIFVTIGNFVTLFVTVISGTFVTAVVAANLAYLPTFSSSRRIGSLLRIGSLRNGLQATVKLASVLLDR